MMVVDRKRRGQNGMAYVELMLITPLLAIILLGSIDLGRLIFFSQVMANLTREAGSLVSRGSTPEQAVAATELSDDPLDISVDGIVIISRVRRQGPFDSTPVIFEQVANGPLSSFTSRVGVLGATANIPGITELDDGVILTAVEIAHDYDPVFNLSAWGMSPWPDDLYDVAWF
ncbi:MAG: pilus assembly protein [Deltaproteobacteria bacterium]|nr:pilus assembly protein [Deltaproteobacteria bacterium]